MTGDSIECCTVTSYRLLFAFCKLPPLALPRLLVGYVGLFGGDACVF